MQKLTSDAPPGSGRTRRALSPEGVPDATFVLGEYHLSGEGGVAKDVEQARRLISASARSGYEPAIERLATMK